MKKLQNALDKGSTVVAAVMCAAMMIILFANVVLRLIPSIGGFKWYMEGGQYINVWSMLIVGICITSTWSWWAPWPPKTPSSKSSTRWSPPCLSSCSM